MSEHYRHRRIGELMIRWRPAPLKERWGVRDVESGQLVADAEYGSEDLAKAKCRMLAAHEIEKLYLGDRPTATQRIRMILLESGVSPSASNAPAAIDAAERIFDFFAGAKA